MNPPQQAEGVSKNIYENLSQRLSPPNVFIGGPVREVVWCLGFGLNK